MRRTLSEKIEDTGICKYQVGILGLDQKNDQTIGQSRRLYILQPFRLDAKIAGSLCPVRWATCRSTRMQRCCRRPAWGNPPTDEVWPGPVFCVTPMTHSTDLGLSGHAERGNTCGMPRWPRYCPCPLLEQLLKDLSICYEAPLTCLVLYNAESTRTSSGNPAKHVL